MPGTNLLAVSVGNTRTRIGAFVDGKLQETAAFENQRSGKLIDAIGHAFLPLREKDNAVVLMASVNPKATDTIERELRETLGREIRHIEQDVAIPIGRQLDPEAIVGADRLLNACAAFDVLQQACVVIDTGTAITVDFVDGAGTFHGGAIAPGGQLMLDALSGRIGHLPEVELSRPDEAIGHNTAQAMLSGVFFGIRGMVRELVEQYAEKAGQYPTVIATGGDGNLLLRDHDLIDRIVPDLTLRGIEVTLRKALESAEDA